MMVASSTCAFCGAAAEIVSTAVLDEKWSHRFGGEPVVALDHGWYTTARGERVVTNGLSIAKSFQAHARALCDYCAHGWAEDVHWRAEPTLLALAERRPPPSRPGVDHAALVRWSQLTAMLAELVDGMPTASSAAQRDAVRRGRAPAPEVGTWFFSTQQRLPARVHLSQIATGGAANARGLVQVVSVDVAHFTCLVVLPSDDAALEVVRRSAVVVEFGVPVVPDSDWPALVRPVDLALTPHPHRVAVHRLCAASSAVAC